MSSVPTRTTSIPAKLCKRSSEFRHVLSDLLDREQVLFILQHDGSPTSPAREFVVRFHPSDGPTGLMAAFGAGDTDLFIIEHGSTPVECESQHNLFRGAMLTL